MDKTKQELSRMKKMLSGNKDDSDSVKSAKTQSP